jgi:hypothetical protein
MASGATLLLLAGCVNSPRFDYVGTWKGRKSVEGQPGADPDVINSLAKVELQVKPTGRFAIYYAPYSMEGTLERTSNGGALPVDLLMGREIERQPEDVRKEIPRLELIPGEDGTLRLKDPRNPSEEIVLKREAKPPG